MRQNWLARAAMYSFGVLVVLGSVASAAFAGDLNPAAPEIDGGTITTGLGLLAGSVLVLRARRAK
jgi:hypothetical protein